MKSFPDRHTSLELCGLFFAAIAMLFSSDSSASRPQRQPLTMSQKMEYSDAIFFGRVRKLHFMERSKPIDASQVKGLAGSIAEVEVTEVILDRQRQLTSF